MGDILDGLKTMLISRVAQLAARGVAIAAVWVAAHLHGSLTPDQLAGVNTETIACVTAVAAVLWDLATHYFQHGSVVTHTADGPGAMQADKAA